MALYHCLKGGKFEPGKFCTCVLYWLAICHIAKGILAIIGQYLQYTKITLDFKETSDFVDSRFIFVELSIFEEIFI